MATEETTKRREYHRKHHEENREHDNERSRDWYYKNRDRVLAERKQRIQDDPEYRARRKEIQRKADAKRYAKLKADKPNPASRTKPLALVAENDNGQMVSVFTLTDVAKMIGRNRTTIYSWQERGHIPKSLWYPLRLYTEHQIELLRQLAAVAKRDHAARSVVSKMIHDSWNNS